MHESYYSHFSRRAVMSNDISPVHEYVQFSKVLIYLIIQFNKFDHQFSGARLEGRPGRPLAKLPIAKSMSGIFDRREHRCVIVPWLTNVGCECL